MITRIDFAAEYNTKGITTNSVSTQETLSAYTDYSDYVKDALTKFKRFFSYSFKNEREMFINVYVHDESYNCKRAYCIFTTWETIQTGTIKVMKCEKNGYCNIDAARPTNPALVYKMVKDFLENINN